MAAKTINLFTPKNKNKKGKYSKKQSVNKASKFYHKPKTGQG